MTIYKAERVEKLLIVLFAVAVILGMIASFIQAHQQHKEIITALYAEKEIQGDIETIEAR